MNKVPVDRELLLFLNGEAELDGMAFGEHPPRRPFWWRKYLRDALSAQPAEAEGAVQCPASHPAECYALGTQVVHASLVHGIVRKADELNAALSAVTAERDRLRGENERLKARPEQALTEALGERLMQSSPENYIETTFGVDGTDEDIVVTLRRSAGKTPHELRLEAEAERDRLRAEVEALRKDASRLDRLDIECEAYGCEGIHEGNRWMIDGPFRTVRDAIDAALAAKEA